MTAWSGRRASQPISSPGGTTSASWRFPRLRHLSALPSASLTTISVRPASLRPATRLDPMNPAPPVTNNIRPPPPALPSLCPRAPRRATSAGLSVNQAQRQSLRVLSRWTGRYRQANGFPAPSPAIEMNSHSLPQTNVKTQTGANKLMSESPILIIPYMWIGDFVRCHTVVKLLKQRFPSRAIDLLTTAMVAPLLDYMPGVRKGVVVDLPRKRLAWGEHRALAERLRRDGYGDALVMPRTWKSALAPYLAGIPARTGFVGEARFGLINDLRWGERRLPRMVDRCAVLALRKGETRPPEWPRPELHVPAAEVAAWRQRLGLAADRRTVVAFAPGAVGASKRWPAGYYAELARRLTAAGSTVWVIGGPGEQELAAEIA